MERVDKYINSIYRNLKVDSSELNDLKSEMRNHLVEAIKELKEEGYSEDESITIALEKFGDKFHLEGELTQVFNIKKQIPRVSILLSVSIIYIVTTYFLGYLIQSYTFSGIELPMNIYPDLSKSCFPTIYVPLLNYKTTTIIKEILYFIPLGGLIPVTRKRFKSVKNIILLTVLIFIVESFFIIIKSLLGMGAYEAILPDLLILNVIGSLLGYGIYSISKKHMKLNF